MASKANHARNDQPRWTAEEIHVFVGPTLARIAALSDLEADWDSYGAEPPSRVAQTEAGRWVEIVASLFAPRVGDQARPYSVAPLADGGVQIEWRGPRGTVELEVGPDGRLGYLLTEDTHAHITYQEADDAPWSDVLRLLIRIFPS